MTKLYPTFKALLVVTFVLTVAVAAQAQATRTWVSGVGDDLNPCSRTAPCKTFAGAISKTAKDGEISVLDPGGYGAVTITKSIYINGTHGAGYGSIIASLVNGVIINITDVNDVRKAVRLRALDINGASTGINGVSILAANNVWIEDSVIDGFTGNGTTTGIGIRAADSDGVTVHVSDTVVHKTVTGLRMTTTTGFAVANIRNCNFEGNTTGIEASTNGFITVKDSRVASQSGDGIKASASGATINVSDCVLSNNVGNALNASIAGATIRALGNQIVNNGTAYGLTGTVKTDGQNRLDGNGSNNAPNGGLVTIN
ncbi:MAG TPA: right-handed parallel beta-helix repeat-containing protein [Pyrinomonadaceae bacterium]|nr:right-handed parallel beta-helix repeat-containing protein [Pyrinomonadaceae bacterium]